MQHLDVDDASVGLLRQVIDLSQSSEALEIMPGDRFTSYGNIDLPPLEGRLHKSPVSWL
jgi:hypothetical protein